MQSTLFQNYIGSAQAKDQDRLTPHSLRPALAHILLTDVNKICLFVNQKKLIVHYHYELLDK